jgi:hypothetical protein
MAEIGSSTDIQNLIEYLDVEEIDGFRESLVNMLVENTDLDPESIYELVLNKGHNITWC